MKHFLLYGLTFFLCSNLFSQDISIKKTLFKTEIDPNDKLILSYEVVMYIENNDTSVLYHLIFKEFGNEYLKIGAIGFYDTIRIERMVKAIETVLNAKIDEKITASFRGGVVFNKTGDLNNFYIREKMNDEVFDESNLEYVTTKLTRKQVEKFISDSRSIYHYLLE